MHVSVARFSHVVHILFTHGDHQHAMLLLSWAIQSTSRWAVFLHTTFLHYKTVVLRTRTFLTTLRERLMEKGPIDDSSNN